MLLTIQILFIVLSIASLVSMVILVISAFKRSILWGIVVSLLSPIAAIVYGIKYFNEVKKPFLVYLGTTISSLVFMGYLFMQMGGMEAINVASKINDGTLTEQDAAKFMVSTMEGVESMTGQGKDEMIQQMQQDPNVTPEQIEQTKQLFKSIEGLASGEIESLEDIQQPMSTQAVDIELKKAEEDLQQAIAKLKQDLAAVKVTKTQVPRETEKNKSQLPPMATYQMKKEEKLVNRKIRTDQAKNYIGQTMTVTMQAGNQRTGRLTKIDGGQLWFEHKAFAGTLTYKLLANDIESIEINN